MTTPADSSVPAQVLFIDHTLLVFFPSFFFLLLLIIAIMGVTEKVSKNEDFFTIYYSFLLFT